MKGQLVFEFVLATLFFLAIVVYTINYLNTTVYLFSMDHYSDSLESKAWQVSELIARSGGNWSGFPPGPPVAIGISDEWPLLNVSKISFLQQYCAIDRSGMMRLLDLDIDYHGIRIEINKTSSGGESNLLDCGFLSEGTQAAKVTRLGVSDIDGSLLRLNVWYW